MVRKPHTGPKPRERVRLGDWEGRVWAFFVPPWLGLGRKKPAPRMGAKGQEKPGVGMGVRPHILPPGTLGIWKILNF